MRASVLQLYPLVPTCNLPAAMRTSIAGLNLECSKRRSADTRACRKPWFDGAFLQPKWPRSFTPCRKLSFRHVEWVPDKVRVLENPRAAQNPWVDGTFRKRISLSDGYRLGRQPQPMSVRHRLGWKIVLDVRERNGNRLIQREQIIEHGIVRGRVERTAAAFGGGRSQHLLFAFSAEDDAV